MNRVDLRSDTVTQPSVGMQEAMANARLGDDVFGEDPTVSELEKKMASLLGKEAGLFVPSGTMSNAIAIRSHTQPGDEIITEERSHIYIYEGGGFAALSGCSIALVPSRNGIMSAENVASKIRKSKESGGHYPNSALICLENTSNRGGGTCYEQECIDEITKVARDEDCAVHMDGARLFNAAISSGIEVSSMVKDCDSVSICISKGLGAPVGGVLVGSKELIERAHRWRKMFGGGMRQAGVLAAAGIYALDNNLDRLEEDHSRAYKLASALNDFKEFELDLQSVQTNIINLKTKKSAHLLVEDLAKLEIDALAIGPNLIRLVTHLHITEGDIEKCIHAFTQL